MLKADMHIHAAGDPKDNLKTSPETMIDYAASLGYEILSFTFHTKQFYNRKISENARKKGILLIPGAELKIEGYDVLVYNLKASEISKLKKLSDISMVRRKDTLIVAPHPFYPRKDCLRKKLIEYIELFDAIEHSFFYTDWFNLNKDAIKIAKRYNKPMIGNSDSHTIGFMDYTYSMINSKKDAASVISAIKKGRVRVVSKPIPNWLFFRLIVKVSILSALKKFRSG